MRLKPTKHGYYHNEVADIIASSGNEDMVPELSAICTEYCLDVLGSERYSQSLVGYCCMHGRFVEGLIPGNYYGQAVIPKVNGTHGRILNLKTVTNTVLRCGGHLPDLAYYINGKCILVDSGCVSLDAVADALQEHARVVIKLDDSSKGQGVYLLDPKELKSFVQGTNVGAFVVQRHIVQHRDLDEFGNSSTSTLRVYTCSDDSGRISYRAAFARFGIGQSEYIQSLHQIKVPISPEGRFSDSAYMPDYSRLSACPATGAPFASFRYPRFDAAVQLAVRLHATVPYIGIIGWDMVVCQAGDIEIMEWNTMHPSGTFIEAVMGPCFLGLGWETLWRH